MHNTIHKAVAQNKIKYKAQCHITPRQITHLRTHWHMSLNNMDSYLCFSCIRHGLKLWWHLYILLGRRGEEMHKYSREQYLITDRGTEKVNVKGKQQNKNWEIVNKTKIDKNWHSLSVVSCHTHSETYR